MKTRAFVNFVAKVFEYLPKLGWLVALGTRLFVGYFFMDSGWGKIHHLDQFTANFEGWGIPYPAFNAALSAYTEFFGGALTIVGLATRFVSLAQMINMLVAILAVNLKDVHSLSDFGLLDEPLYLLTYAWLGVYGPGWPSRDAIIKRFLTAHGPSAEAARPVREPVQSPV
jgi:putative oxidoreductase